MNYQTCLEHLYTANLRGMKLGLANMQKMCALLDMPQLAYKTIHVAGTNGKGSCVTKLAAALRYDGQTVGLYTSPHISTFRERIQVNGKMISEEEVTLHLQKLFHLAEQHGLYLTFFEYTTCLAFLHFQHCNVAYAVLETGLGGRLDATNVCAPVLTVITSISLDHTEQLGQTEEEIAFEKAGIIKPGVPCVIGPRVPVQVVQKQADKVGARLIRAKGDYSNYEEENQLIARAAMEMLAVSSVSLAKAIKVVPPCRFEVIDVALAGFASKPKKVILDVAHNLDGIKKLCERIDEPAVVLAGFSRDKDVTRCLELLKKRASDLYLVESTSSRSLHAWELKALVPEAHAFEAIDEGMEEAFRQAGEKNLTLLVCGTFYIMSAARKFLGFSEQEDLFDLREKVRA